MCLVWKSVEDLWFDCTVFKSVTFTYKHELTEWLTSLLMTNKTCNLKLKSRVETNVFVSYIKDAVIYIDIVVH